MSTIDEKWDAIVFDIYKQQSQGDIFLADASTLQEDDDHSDDAHSGMAGSVENKPIMPLPDQLQPSSTLQSSLSQIRSATASAGLTTFELEAYASAADNPIERALDNVPGAVPPQHSLEFPEWSDEGIREWSSWDFITCTPNNITLLTSYEDFLDLMTITAHGAIRRKPKYNPHDATHALLTSLNALLSTPMLIAKNVSPFSLKQLNDIVNNERYQQLWEYHALRHGLSSQELVAKPQSSSAHTVHQLAIILHIVGETIGHYFQLGICSSRPPSDDGVPRYEVERIKLYDEGIAATTVWLVNEHHGGEDQSYWSGMAPEPCLTVETQTVAMSTPRHQRTSSAQLRGGKSPKSLTKAEKKPKTLTFRAKPSSPSVSKASPPPIHNHIFCPEEGCKRHHDAEGSQPFTDQKALRNHRKNAHTPKDERKHHCKDCDEHFVYFKDLKRHIKNIHTKDHPQWCLVQGCHLFGPTHGQPKSNLKRHYKVHDLEQWHVCKSRFGLK